MASFTEHIDQAKRNLAFLCETNSMSNVSWDWQVTIAYYVGVHFMNAHLAQVANFHYRSHEAIKNAISPAVGGVAMLPNDIYLSYGKLEGLSRRSRYLCHQDPAMSTELGNHVTIPKHFAKAIKHLDRIINYFVGTYSISITPPPEIECEELTKQALLNVFVLKIKAIIKESAA
ncbi:MAG TPA: hypothetical protein PLU58_11600 [Saprospiraceae bacterium]|nr:hypothetical protein [Saprospiraceae bacterium]